MSTPILFIAYQFPPRGGPGVHRSINFVKYLNEFGYLPTVLTTDEKTLVSEGVSVDRGLLSSLDSNVKIIRTANNFFPRFCRLLLKLRIYRLIWFVFYPFMFDWSFFWVIRNYYKAKKIIKANNIRLVYTSSSPFSSWILGYFLKKRMGVKWIADIRDPFTDGYMWRFPSFFHWKKARSFEEYLLKRADKVIVNTPEVERLYIKRGFLDKSKLCYLTNGF